MGVKTEDFVPSLPPKTVTENIDWFAILDSFDPTVLDEKYLNECARRNPYETCYKWDTPSMPIEERLKFSQRMVRNDRQTLTVAVNRIKEEGLTPLTYKNAREVLVRCIGQKGAAEYNRREFERLGEAGRKRQAEAYAAYEKARNEKSARQEKIIDLARADPYFLEHIEDYELNEAELDELEEMLEAERKRGYEYQASVHEKVIRVRKGFKGSNGKPLIQRDFAKLIDYPINKYAEAEKVDKWGRESEPESPVDFDLLEKLVMICHANPYWLFDSDCEEYMAQEDENSESVVSGDEPSLFVKPDVILKWIMEGKPRNTRWEHGIVRKK